MKKVIWVDGGIGRVICSIPAIDEMAKKEKVIVVTPWKDIFLNKKNIHRLYKPDSEYLWEDVIANNDLIHVEPYWDVDYYKNKIHLSQAFNKLINNKEIIEDLDKPEIVLNTMEEDFAKKFIKDIKKKTNKKIMILQPFGSTGRINDDNKVIDQTNRSLNMNTLDRIVNEFKNKYTFIYIGTLTLDKHNIKLNTQDACKGTCNTRQKQQEYNNKKTIYPIPQDLGLRGIFSIIKHSDAFIGCDSFAQHVSYAFDVPSIVLIGGTDENNICYPNKHLILKKKGYPKEYNPFRIPNNNHIIFANEGAMDFTKKELDDFVEEIKEYLKKPNGD